MSTDWFVESHVILIVLGLKEVSLVYASILVLSTSKGSFLNGFFFRLVPLTAVIFLTPGWYVGAAVW